MHTLCLKVLLCVSLLWNSAAKKKELAFLMVSSWGALGSSTPPRICLPSEKTGPSQDSTGSYYLQNSHLEQLQGAGH